MAELSGWSHIVSCKKQSMDAMEALLVEAGVVYNRLNGVRLFLVNCSEEQAEAWRKAGYTVTEDFAMGHA